MYEVERAELETQYRGAMQKRAELQQALQQVERQIIALQGAWEMLDKLERKTAEGTGEGDR